MKNNTEKIKNKLNIHTTNYVGRGNQYKGIAVSPNCKYRTIIVSILKGVVFCCHLQGHRHSFMKVTKL